MDRREATVAVPDPYGRWCVAPPVEEAVRLATYVATLERDQSPAGVYAESISELARSEPDSDPGRGSEPRAALG